MDNIVLSESTFYILLSLTKPQHGYGIMQTVENLSKGRVNLGAGTLYGALSKMTEKKWIALLPIDSESRKKNYKLTKLGQEILKEEIKRLKELVENGEKIMGGCIHE